MKLKNLFVFLLVINMFVLSIVVFIVSDYNKATKELEDAYIMQHKSFLLADELRQSSDDLTRVARTYVITGNPMYEEQFQTILNIRNGVIPRPKNYNGIYWDFLTLKNSQPKPEGEAIPLKTLMVQAGFLEDELALLFESQKESDDLTNLEAKAMNAVKGIFQDEKGKYTKKGEPNFKLAREIMHSDEYHKAKIAIMKPIDKFYKAFETRTKKKIEDAHLKVKQLENYASYSIIALILLVLFTFYIFVSRIINPLEVIKNIMLRLSNNDMEVYIPKDYAIDEVGELIGTAEVFKSNAIKLIESEQQNKLLLNLAGEGIFGLDKMGCFTFLNPMACTLLGLNEQHDLIGQSFYKTILHPQDNAKLSLKEKLFLHQKEDMHFKTLHNGLLPIDYVSTPIYNKKGLLEGSVVVFSDSTVRKKNEDKLKQAIIEAQSSSRSKSIFLANMSHELRTPLNAILGFTSLLKKSMNINNEEKENLNIIHSSGKHLLSIINEILELSKIEAGKIEIKPTDFNLKEFLEDIRQMFETRCHNKGIEFELRLHKDIPTFVIADELRLRQVMINLLENAYKFTNEGKIELRVMVKDNQLYIEVIDSGIGISSQNLELIFKAFEQVKLDKASSGSGLGLAISKELVKKMGGDLTVQSETNIGSTFGFMIDIGISNNSVPSAKNESQQIVGIRNTKEKTILIVDDVLENRTLLKQLLKPYNFTLLEASNGLEVIELVKHNTIDLILMDILMPKLDGLQTTKVIKEELNKTIPIVMVSAYAFEEDKEKAYHYGASAYLSKPIVEEELYAVLKNRLDLEYIYEQSTPENSLESSDFIEPALLDEIQALAKSFNGQAILKVLSKLPTSNQHRQQIEQYTQNFDFEGLLEYLKTLLK